MITKTDIIVDQKILDGINLPVSEDSAKVVINKPTKDFFYDPWILKEQYLAWKEILQDLPPHGEARLINIPPGRCYMGHADIDNRYHLNLTGEQCYLIDLDNKKMFNTVRDYTWYYMETDKIHTASNFGSQHRWQLVVRELLKDYQLEDSVHFTVSVAMPVFNVRYIFDSYLSPILNKAHSNGKLANFKKYEDRVEFDLSNSMKDIFIGHPKELKFIQT